MKNTVYKLKNGTDLNELAKLGYDIIPGVAPITIVKVIPQPLDGPLAQRLLEEMYLNPKWIEQIYRKNKRRVQSTLGLRYDKEGQPIMTKKFEQILTQWRIQIEPDEDGWIGFTPLDPFMTRIFYGSQMLDLYFKEEIEMLDFAGLIEKVEVEGDE